MRTIITAVALTVILILSFIPLSCAEEGQEEGQKETISKEEVPAAVLEAFDAAYPQAIIRGYTEEIEEAHTVYEISFTFEGRSIDAVYHPDGSVSAIEEVISAEEIPENVQQAMTREIPQFSLKLAEKIKKDNQISYEVRVINTQDTKLYILHFSDTGELIEKEVRSAEDVMPE